ncbi:MAG TPA: DUF1587 domain-containing protein, partial [Steroidobacteraceae bacterium]|nr:DUF1587 domain-containing protein [Steroidobacteraceae bacterium]
MRTRLNTTVTSRIAMATLGVALGAACASAWAADSVVDKVKATTEPAAQAPQSAATPGQAPAGSAPSAGSAPAPAPAAAAGGSAPSAGAAPSGSASDAPGGAGGPGAPTEWQFFDHYCSKCHNSTDWAGGVAFDTMTPEGIGDDAQVWEEAVRKLRGRLMPPPDKPQPDQGAIDTQVGWLESKLDAVAAAHPNPGNVVMHRLNRTEYAREIENLLGLKIDSAALLPKDTKADGFDNVASVLKVSPSFLDQYIVAAHDVSVQAMGDAAPAPASVVYRAPQNGGQDNHLEGLPL